MTYDPAWDMPLRNWQQRGSFLQAIAPPEDGSLDAPLVCLPPINQLWLPIVLGCLDQLCNPSSWSTLDDDALNAVLEQATLLKQSIGVRAECAMPFELRASGCELQSSTDGGETWAEVSGWADFLTNCIPDQTSIRLTSDCHLQESFDLGATWETVGDWDENFGECVQAHVPIIGLPPNPTEETPQQLTCSIAAYVASQIILGAMGAAVTAVQDDLTLLGFGASVLSLIPEFILVRAGYDAIAAIYGAVSEGSLSDYEDAIADGTLWLNVTCAIYGAILADGYITPGNFAAVVSAVGGISYSHSDVISAITTYMDAVGATGIAQLSQGAGIDTAADCSDCSGNWCFTFDFTSTDGGWGIVNGVGAYVPTSGWTSTFDSYHSQDSVNIDKAFTSVMITNITVGYTAASNSGGAYRNILASGGQVGNLPTTSGTHLEVFPLNAFCSSIQIDINTDTVSEVGSNLITSVKVEGIGTCPFGASNC